jgi:hypothetical protein
VATKPVDAIGFHVQTPAREPRDSEWSSKATATIVRRIQAVMGRLR